MDKNGAPGELVYEYTLELSEPIEYGASIQAVISGQSAPPAAGLRVDIPFRGDVSGRVQGKLEGIDYLNIRADGRMDLDLKGSIVTADGQRIAFSADGVALPRRDSTTSDLRENVRLTTASADYAWVNTLQLWAVGEADLMTRKGWVRVYVA